MSDWGGSPLEAGADLRAAVGDLLRQELSFSSGHLTALLDGCLFAPSILTFWFVNGLVDFSTAVVGSVGSTAGLLVRLYADLSTSRCSSCCGRCSTSPHPGHRREVLSGACSNLKLLRLDWFTVGIPPTGLPLALQDLGP